MPSYYTQRGVTPPRPAIVRIDIGPAPHPDFAPDTPPGARQYLPGSLYMPAPPANPEWGWLDQQRWIDRVKRHWPRRNNTARHVAAALMRLLHPGAALYPTLATILYTTNTVRADVGRSPVDERTIRRKIADLTDQGFLIRFRRKTRDAHGNVVQTSNAYVCTLPDDAPSGFEEAETPAVEPAEFAPYQPEITVTLPDAPVSSATNCPSNRCDDSLSNKTSAEGDKPLESLTLPCQPELTDKFWNYNDTVDDVVLRVRDQQRDLDFETRLAATVAHGAFRGVALRNARRRVRYAARPLAMPADDRMTV